MKKRLLSMLLAVAFTAMLLTACSTPPKNTEPSQNQGKTLPSDGKVITDTTAKSDDSGTSDAEEGFVLRDLTGKTVKLSDFKGKKVYVDLWATWCPACLRSLPEIAELAKSNPDFVVLTVVAPGVSGELGEADFKKWLEAQSDLKGLPVLIDDGGKLMQKLRLRAFPSGAYYDSKGNLHKFAPGAYPVRLIKETINAMP